MNTAQVKPQTIPMNPTQRYAYSRNGDQGRVDEKCLVRVLIPTVDSSNDGKVRYHVRVTNVRSGQVWEVARRFSEFLQLRNELIEFFAKTDNKCPGCRNYEKVLKLFEFPRKHVFTSVTPVVINYRKKALRSFVAMLASHTFTTTPKCPTCSGFLFTGVRDWLTTKVVAETGFAGSSARGSPVNEAIRDTMNVKDFTAYIPVTNSMPVDQEGRFVGSTVSTCTPPTSSSVTQKESHSPLSSQTTENTRWSSLRSKDSNHSTASISGPLSPPSVDEFVMPEPRPLSGAGSRVEKDIDIVDDEERFESFTNSASSDASRSRNPADHPAREPPASDDCSLGDKNMVVKQHFKFARCSIAGENERLSNSRSLIDNPDQSDDYLDQGVNGDGVLNMDFMNSVYGAPKTAEQLIVAYRA
ncbi:hypothetical protein PsorP6_004278 [Peronosclerospora sorghi]|uniref:Uncharacterized protein n=1 Tax=Peronosclerospora sorghi TaxID=230839 RepID=A0ACC0VJ98_9STRA|nr:hypothetical protein PsorP6_004278 [Peronosclerospora sorghi]